MKFYYIVVFLVSLLLADLQVISVLNVGTFNVYALDFVYILIFLCTIASLWQLRTLSSFGAMKVYLFFLAWIIFKILSGLTIFGFRALGEARYAAGFFAVFIPFIFFPHSEKRSTKEILAVFQNTLLVAAAAGIILFAIEITIGGRFFISEFNREYFTNLEDFRGTRILGSEETFNIGALLISLVAGTIVLKKFSPKIFLTAAALFLVILLTRNRAAPVSLFAALLLFMVFSGRLKRLAIVGMSLIIAVSFVWIVIPERIDEITLAFGGILDIESDPTGNWRYLVQLSAIKEALQFPIVGQGFGAYFSFFVPELEQVITAPPHNIFVYLFLKTGIIGALLAFAVVVAFLKYLYENRAILVRDPSNHQFYIVFLVLMIAQIPYGFAYGYSTYFGLYFGFGILFVNSLRKLNQRNPQVASLVLL